MTNKWLVTIGIEIHLELNTKTKMFSSSKNEYNALPNTNISIFDIGYPGSMPIVNKNAVLKAIKLAKALNMKIDNELHFDRKHYFYPDLPRGFQITQHFRPIATNGKIKVNEKDVEIGQIQLEEDTAKSIHINDETLLNYNRSGIPLIEIITKPTITSAAMASEYVAKIRQLAKFLEISDAKMEEGSLRADLNISIRRADQTKLGTKVEIKNINSITNLKKAALLEIEEQKKTLLSGGSIKQVTKRYDDKQNTNLLMRSKEGVIDYKYFPEPNIPPLEIPKSLITQVEIKESPQTIEAQFKKWGFNESIISQLLNDKSKLNYIREVNYNNIKKVTNVFFAEIIALANKQNVHFQELKIKPSEIKFLLEQIDQKIISGAHLKKIIPLLVDGKNAANIIKEHGFKQLSNESEIEKMIDEIMTDYYDFIEVNKNRIERLNKFLVGKLMKATKGQANPQIASKIVKRKLAKIV